MFEGMKKWLASSWGYSDDVKVSEAPATKRDPKKIAIKKIGNAIKGRGGSEFEESTVDLTEITRSYNTDSYIKRSVDKYSELMFKAGWEIAGKNEAASEYVWMRLKLMSEATGQPIEELFKDIGQDLVLYGNAFVVKARQKSGGGVSGVTAVGYSGKQPIAGYFVLPPSTIQISRDDQGKIVQYQQDIGSGADVITIKPEDMIHFYYKKPRGRAFGIPYIFPVLDDVLLLRQIEENVARLIYRNLFPLFQFQVGLDKAGFEATTEELEELREQIREMPMDGAIVVPERHNISVVSNSGAILDAEGYLKYFRQRVFSGLGVSDIVMGIGDTANRGTADNLSAEMIDGVKEFQTIFKLVIQDKIINEILFEGGFDPILNIDDEVEFNFFEIELDAKIKKENHLVQLFTQNAITHEELRQLMGLDPVADEGRLYFNMVTAALNAQAAQEKAAAANASGSNKNQPANQNGKKPSPKKTAASAEDGDFEDDQDDSDTLNEDIDPPSNAISEQFSNNILTEQNIRVNLHSELRIETATSAYKRLWSSYKDDIVGMLRSGRSKDQIKSLVIELARQSLKSHTERHTKESFYLGLTHGREQAGFPNIPSTVYYEADKLTKLSTSYIDRLINDLANLVYDAIGNENPIEQLSKIAGAFDSNEYRLDFIAKTELYRSYNYGLALVGKHAGKTTASVLAHGDCETCKEKSSKPVELNSSSLLDAIPPHHPNCTCTIQL